MKERVKEYQGKTIREVAKELNIPRTTVARWFKKLGVKNSREVCDELFRRCYTYFLQKDYFSSLSLRQKYIAFCDHGWRGSWSTFLRKYKKLIWEEI